MPDDPPRLLPLAPPPAASAPVFERVAIVGLGLIGGSIALAARERWPAALVIGVDENAVLERAMVRHLTDVAADDLVVAAEADLIILAAPVRGILDLVERLPAEIPGSAVVTDVGSTKRLIVDAAARLPARLPFVGGHPLGGAARQGIEHARADLFAGRPWILTPAGPSAEGAVDRLSQFIRALGATPVTMDAAEHDTLLASLSHLPQLVASTLMAVVGELAGDAGLGLSGRGLVDTTRLASSPADVWADICATNESSIRVALDRLIDELARLRTGLDDAATIEAVFERANRWRARLEATRLESPRRRQA